MITPPVDACIRHLQCNTVVLTSLQGTYLGLSFPVAPCPCIFSVNSQQIWCHPHPLPCSKNKTKKQNKNQKRGNGQNNKEVNTAWRVMHEAIVGGATSIQQYSSGAMPHHGRNTPLASEKRAAAMQGVTAARSTRQHMASQVDNGVHTSHIRAEKGLTVGC